MPADRSVPIRRVQGRSVSPKVRSAIDDSRQKLQQQTSSNRAANQSTTPRDPIQPTTAPRIRRQPGEATNGVETFFQKQRDQTRQLIKRVRRLAGEPVGDLVETAIVNQIIDDTNATADRAQQEVELEALEEADEAANSLEAEAIDDQEEADQPTAEPPSRASRFGRDLGQAVRSRLGDQVKSKVTTQLESAALKKLGGAAIAKAAQTRGLALLGPYGALAATALEAWKYRKQIYNAQKKLLGLIVGSVVIVMGVIALLIFAIGASAGTDAAANGTTPVQAVDTGSTADLKQIETVLAGGIDTRTKAEQLLAAARQLKISLANNAGAQALVSDIEVAAQKLLDQFDDETVRDQQLTIIKDKIKALQRLLPAPGADSTTLPNGVSVLKVPGVGESRQGQCGVASVTMVLLFLAQERGVSYVNPDLFDANTRLTNRNKLGNTCVGPGYLTSQAKVIGSPKTDWTPVYITPHTEGVTVSKQGVLEIIQRSLAGGDPVILLLGPGGIFDNQHIFPVVGYDSSTDTYYINNPYVKDKHNPNDTGVILHTNQSGGRGRGVPLTGQHLMDHMTMQQTYGVMMARKVYTQ